MTTRVLGKRRADLIAVLEALYSLESDQTAWRTQLLEAFTHAGEGYVGTGMLVVAHGADLTRPRVLDSGITSTLDPGILAWEHAVQDAPAEAIRPTLYPGRPVTTHREVEAAFGFEATAMFRTMRAAFGWDEVIGVLAYPEPGMVGILFAPLTGRIELGGNERLTLHRIAAHLDSAIRLRIRPELAVVAVLAPDGTLRDLLDDDLDRERRVWFGDRVKAIEAARTQRSGRANLDPWWALFEGRYSLVPAEDRDGKRHYLLVANSPTTQTHSQFTQAEIEVVRMAARGFTSKLIAYNLGVSKAHVSDTLLAAATKLGLASRHDLLRVCTAMFNAPYVAELGSLTSAEREVLELLRAGLSNEEIARRRERSPNTIKNQVAAILRKTATSSRRVVALSRDRR